VTPLRLLKMKYVLVNVTCTGKRTSFVHCIASLSCSPIPFCDFLLPFNRPVGPGVIESLLVLLRNPDMHGKENVGISIERGPSFTLLLAVSNRFSLICRRKCDPLFHASLVIVHELVQDIHATILPRRSIRINMAINVLVLVS
jgi:hypothetical protein